MSTGGKSKKQSKKSKKTPKKARRKPEALPLDRPFEASVLSKAEQIADSYRVLIEPNPEVGFFGRCVELPGAMGDGETVEVCVRQTREAMVSLLATMLEMGERPPTPASAFKRDRQVNIRLTVDEKERLEEAARTAGFRSISDYIRYSALKSA